MPESARPDLAFVGRTARHRILWRGPGAPLAAPGAVTLTADAPEGLASFASIETLLRSLTVELGGLPEDLRRIHLESLRETVPSLVGEAPRTTGHFFNAESVGSAIVRRISRESIHLSDAIDSVARLLLTLVHHIEEARGESLVLVLDHAERLDRPSARVLHRAHQLADRPLHWVWRFDAPVVDSGPEPKDPLLQRFVRARRRLFSTLAEALLPELRDLPRGAAYVPEAPAPDSSVEAAVATELVGQNYDLAYLRATHMTPGRVDDSTANVYRMLCIVDANVGEIERATESIALARDTAATTWLRAHCHYMTGLLLTKRHYDLDGADGHYAQGLELLGDATDSLSRLERSWLVNGRSLVSALKCKSLPPADRDEEAKRIFVQEVEAFKAVADQDSAQALYLQLNLLANMTLLLEMNQDCARAAFFWSQVFDKFRGDRTEVQRTFEVAFRYRLGMLLFKAGRAEEAAEHLAEAVSFSDAERRRFTHQRTLYALGFVQHGAGQHEEALNTFSTAAALAADLRDPEALRRACVGALTVARAARIPDEAAYWGHALDQVDQVTAAVPEGTVPPDDGLATPPPKFPSYVPLIDLEATPIVDLNQFLANDRSTRAIADVVREGKRGVAA